MATGSQAINGPQATQSINGYKGAQSDALKKAASLFGIALELYRDATEQEEFEAFKESLTPDTWTAEAIAENQQEYDYLIDDKEKKIKILDESLERKTKSYAKLEKEVEDLEKSLQNVEQIKKEHVFLQTDADFEDGNILTGYKKIKDGFRFDVESVIKNFLSSVKEDGEHYKLYCNVKNYFSHSSIYTIMTYQVEEQKLIINELLSEEEKNVLSKLINKKKFNIVKFLGELDDLILKSNPEIQIYIGNKNDNFNHLNENITTIYDDKITEGFRIVYRGIVYDYSI
jgi:hypothetical protein